MRAFSSGPFRGSSDPWFRAGTFNVGTTELLTGIGVLSILIYTIEGSAEPRPFSKYFWLTPAGFSNVAGPSVLEGGVWRLVTWPLMLEPNARVFWAVILIAIFYMLGSQVEQRMGRREYSAYLAVLTVVPGVVATLLDAALSISGTAAGLRFLELAVLISFALILPEARFFFGIPAWGVALGVVVIEMLQTIADSNWFGLLVGGTIVLLALLLTRSMGHAETYDWIPRLRLPGLLGPTNGYGQSYGQSAPRPKRARRKGRGNLTAVPSADPVQDDLADMEIDALLDQVAEEGLDSLTKEQRKRLEQHSKRLRKRND